jgi:hypothetical protein
MKAISAPRIGVDAADRAERGLGSVSTLRCPICLRLPYLPKGAKGAGCGGQALCWCLPRLLNLPQGAAGAGWAAALGKGLKGGSPSCRAAAGRLSGLGRLSLCRRGRGHQGDQRAADWGAQRQLSGA